MQNDEWDDFVLEFLKDLFKATPTILFLIFLGAFFVWIYYSFSW